jgi:small acid-soluble spore protein A (major alpha-type SASP)
VFGGTTAGFGGMTTQQGGIAQQSTGGGGGGGGGNNEILVSQARAAMETFKNQTASELGIQNYAQQYKGDLPSRVNGSVGGYMVKKMIALAEQQLSGSTGGTTTQ